MITLEAIREAILSEEPAIRLDQIVRAEMAAGQRIKQIYERFAELMHAIDDTPGVSEDGEEALIGTLDALSGMCHPKCQYYDPPELPSQVIEPEFANPTPPANGARR